MDTTILKAENISKQYRLGVVGSGTLRDDFKRLVARVRGKEDPFLKVGDVNDRSKTSSEDYVWALRDINFEVRRGEVLGIIGKNGAGKSTLLKILSRVTAPTTGTIKSRGRIASLLEVGTGFNPELTGRENIYLNGAILGMTKAEITSKLDEIIAFSGCERYIDTPTKRYSSGMTVRLAFAVAAHLEPEILVVDEVLAVGDAEFQKKAIGKMQDISSGEGRTVLFVSHNMASVQNLCTRGILLENGTVTIDDKVNRVIEKYMQAAQHGASEELIKGIDSTERTGSMVMQIKNVELVTEKVGRFPATGSPLTFKFELDNPQHISIKDLRLDFRVDDYMGQRLLWFSTSIFENEDKRQAYYISFHLNKLPLNSGQYFVTTHLSVKNEIADWAKNAFHFNVEEGFFYHSFKKVATSQSKVLTDFELLFND
ncbi:ABC transporter ATP-binding protein [Flavimarina sp. Hel_I_48]|uniref:ABC transporter ATP-binding protein n=1 Tax=Flavimarina sp. Hel_I_48 TaxID=1392488 RepID=UPI0004DF33C2|nr:ABC transporter ATP-binding protein [Flavimarina sp. Hel_I_48]